MPSKDYSGCGEGIGPVLTRALKRKFEVRMLDSSHSHPTWGRGGVCSQMTVMMNCVAIKAHLTVTTLVIVKMLYINVSSWVKKKVARVTCALLHLQAAYPREDLPSHSEKSSYPSPLVSSLITASATPPPPPPPNTADTSMLDAHVALSPLSVSVRDV